MRMIKKTRLPFLKPKSRIPEGLLKVINKEKMLFPEKKDEKNCSELYQKMWNNAASQMKYYEYASTPIEKEGYRSHDIQISISFPDSSTEA